MNEDKHQALFSLAKDYLDVTIRIDLGTRFPNGTGFARSFAKLVGIARIYYMDAAINRGLVSSRDDKEALAIFDAVVDDYIFGKIMDPISQVRREPIKSPMEWISDNAKVSS
jgi:hypothetical protein